MVDDSEIRGFLRDGYARVVGAVALVTRSLPAAEDAVQEAIVRAWERSERGERIEALGPWVATVALNLSRSGVRRSFAERRARQRLSAPLAAAAAPSGERIDLERALARLPARQREAIVLRSFLELSVSEIARAMRTTEGTVKSQLAKARTALAASLAVDPDPEPEVSRADA